MGLRAIVVLVLLAAGLGALLYFTDERPPTARVAESAVLEGRSLRDATLIRWQFKDQAPIEIGRAPDGRFQLKEPTVDIASAAYLKQIVDTWDSAQMRKTPLADDTEGRQKAGLAPPELVFSVQWPDKASADIEVGAPGPLGTSRFLRTHGAIWEGGDSLLESMRVGLDDLRERTVFRAAFAHASELVVDQALPSGKRETLHLKLDGKEWRLLAPVQGRADPIVAQQYVTAVLGLRVDDFKPGIVNTPAREPEMIVKVRSLHGEEEAKLWLEGGQLFGQLPARGIWFSTDNLQIGFFENAAEKLRARILVPMGEGAFTELVELVVDPGEGRGDRLRLTRESATSDWRLLEPVQVDAAATPCNEAAYALQMLAAREFVTATDGKRPRAEDPRYGLGPTRLTVSAKTAGPGPMTILWLGSDERRGDDVFVHACRADEPDTVVLVQKAQATTLARSWLDYCALRVLRLTATADRMELWHRDGRRRAFQIDDGKWALVGTPGARMEVGDIVRDTLRDLVGTRAVDARSAAFEQPDWRIVLMRKEGDKLALLRVWDRGPDSPLVLQKGSETEVEGDPQHAPLAFEVTALIGKQLRDLWQ